MRYNEKEIKSKAIKNVKDSNEFKMKIKEAKIKLKEDEKELDLLWNDSSGLSQAKEKLSQKEN